MKGLKIVMFGGCDSYGSNQANQIISFHNEIHISTLYKSMSGSVNPSEWDVHMDVGEVSVNKTNGHPIMHGIVFVEKSG